LGVTIFNSKCVVATFSIILVAVLFSSPVVTAASPPQPTYGIANVDGDITEWVLNKDFFAGMYNGWNEDNTHEASVYLRYDVSSGVLYVLVLTESGWTGIVSVDDSFVSISTSDDRKINDQRVKGDDIADGDPPDFVYVGTYTKNNVDYCEGFEASFKLPLGSWWIAAHMNVVELNDAGVSSVKPETAGTNDKTIPLVLQSLTVVPEAPYGATLMSVLLACGLFVAYRKKQKHF